MSQRKRHKEARGEGFGPAAQTTPQLGLVVAGSGTAQGGGSFHEKSEGTSCKFNYCLNLYTEIILMGPYLAFLSLRGGNSDDFPQELARTTLSLVM